MKEIEEMLGISRSKEQMMNNVEWNQFDAMNKLKRMKMKRILCEEEE